MKTFNKLLTFCVLCASINNAHALTQTGVQPTMVGSENNGANVFVGLSQNPNNCIYAGVYFMSPYDVKAALSVALAAKMAGKTVQISYTGGSGSQCIGSAIYVEN